MAGAHTESSVPPPPLLTPAGRLCGRPLTDTQKIAVLEARAAAHDRDGSHRRAWRGWLSGTQATQQTPRGGGSDEAAQWYFDTQPDPDNLAYGCLYRMDVASYQLDDTDWFEVGDGLSKELGARWLGGRVLATEADGHRQARRGAGRYFGARAVRRERSRLVRRRYIGERRHHDALVRALFARTLAFGLTTEVSLSSPRWDEGSGRWEDAVGGTLALSSAQHQWTGRRRSSRRYDTCLSIRDDSFCTVDSGLMCGAGAAEVQMRTGEAGGRLEVEAGLLDADTIAVGRGDAGWAEAAGATGESVDEYVLRRTREYNVLTRERPFDLSVWMQFAAFQVRTPVARADCTTSAFLRVPSSTREHQAHAVESREGLNGGRGDCVVCRTRCCGWRAGGRRSGR